MLAWQTKKFLGSKSGAMATPSTYGLNRKRDRVRRRRSESAVAGGVALRFARVKRYRSDKTTAEADTIETVQKLRSLD